MAKHTKDFEMTLSKPLNLSPKDNYFLIKEKAYTF